jgi:hypothetical protein
MIEPEVVELRTRRVQVDETTGALVETPEGTQVEVAASADRQLFEEAFLSALNDGAPVVADIPAPQVTVRFDGDGCSFEGPTTFTADGGQTRIIAELVNETEIGMTVVTGYHDGVSWGELVADVEEYRQTGVPPAYWVLTGSIDLNGKSVTGGRTVAPLDLRPGTHALVCANVEDELSPLADIVVVGS